jgi:hypothetical protein
MYFLPYFFFSNIPIIGIKIQILENILLDAYNVFGIGEGGGFRSTKLLTHHKS